MHSIPHLHDEYESRICQLYGLNKLVQEIHIIYDHYVAYKDTKGKRIYSVDLKLQLMDPSSICSPIKLNWCRQREQIFYENKFFRRQKTAIRSPIDMFEISETAIQIEQKNREKNNSFYVLRTNS